MTVCACQNVTLDEIVDMVEKYGNDPEVIKTKANIGKGCGECLETSCDSVDLPWPYAMANAQAILKHNATH
jgi:bacterioferritin-associated ferredoxin